MKTKRVTGMIAAAAVFMQCAGITAGAAYSFDETAGMYSCDFADCVTEAVTEPETVSYNGLDIHLQPGDSISASDGVVFAGNGAAETRCIEYTPEYDGILNVTYYMNNNASKYMYSYIYDGTDGTVEAQVTTGGRADALLTAVCSAGHTYYLYSVGNGSNDYGQQIKYVTYTVPELGEQVDPQLTYHFAMDESDEGITYYGAHGFEPGQTGSAASFDGGYAELDVFPLGSSFTFSAWVKPSELGSWERLFDFGSGTDSYIFLTLNEGSGLPRLAVKNGGDEENITSSVLLRSDVWAYVTVTMTGSMASIYINGEKTASGLIKTPVSSLSGSTGNYIGKSQYASDPNYSGMIDEIEIYNYAMDAGEITARMKETAAAVSGFAEIKTEIETGETPRLPAYAEVIYENGMTSKTPVEWSGLEPVMTQGEHIIMGKTTIAGTEYEVKASVNAVSESLDENYSVTRSLNFVKNTGTSFVEAIYDVYTEKTDELLLRLTVTGDDGTSEEQSVTFTPSDGGGEVSAKIELGSEAAEYTVKSQLLNNVTGEPVTAERERVISMSSNYADAADISLEKDSIFEKSAETGLEYVKSIDVDRLLAPSYEMHELEAPNGAQRYGGWERKGANNWTSSGGAETYTLAGHSLGHWMSAAAVFYRETGDEEILDMLDYAVEKLDELQRTTGSGYIGGCEETVFERCFAGDANWVDGYWVPWYGVHKIYQGLLDAYDYTENTKAFTVLKKFADWAADGTAGLTDAQMQSVLNVEYGGMNEIFARMYEITGDEEYLDTAVRFTHDSVLDPLADGRDELTGLHANTQIPKIIGAAEIYEQDPEDHEDYRRAAENFWHFVNDDRGYVIGGNSIAEHFETEGAETLGIKTCESCNTYNMMRLTEHLFDWDHNSEYMDWYEKALYNHILGQQDPDTGAKMYFVSLLQGHHRVYEVKDESWWCCTGTGMENPGRYTRTAYYEDGDALYVNLYMPGSYTWEEKGLTFSVETEYPYSDKVKITVISGTADADIKLRAPGWLEENMTASAHSENYMSGGGEYLTVPGTWTEGDVIDITIPMNVRVYESRTEGQIAYEYGPVVLAAELGTVEGVPGVEEYISNETRIDSVTADVPYIITNGEDPKNFVSAVDTSSLTFKIDGEYVSDGNDVLLRPFYEIHHSFHNVYWNLDSGGDEYEKRLNDITIDKVEPDGQQDEIGHGLQSQDSHQGTFNGGGTTYFFRDAYGSADAYFSYSLEVDGSAQNYLFVRYWGSDVPFSSDNVDYTRDFNILIDGQKLASQQINNNAPGSPYDVFYTIPREYTDGKETVTVRFEVKDDRTCAGGILQMRTTSSDSMETEQPPAVTAEAKNGTVTFDSEYDESCGYDMYIALYDSDGRLAGLEKNAASGAFAAESGTYTLKAFFWNGMEPKYESTVIDGLTV